MSMNPIRYTERVVKSFLRYQVTAYPFSDLGLNTQMKSLLQVGNPWKTPLMNGPYISLSRSFSSGAEVSALVQEGILHPHMRQRIPSEIKAVYGHQEAAIRAIYAKRTTLVSTGTGSGKSECFLYPIISKCLELRDANAPAGISAVIVYPMNALAEDQLQRLRELLAGTGISFGMYVGKTPEAEREVTHTRLQSGASQADYVAERNRYRKEGKEGSVVPAEERCSRESMRLPGGQPRILLTNVKQLELLLTRQTDVELFQEARLDFLVFDEAHTFTGAQGAETACLIRRLRHFVGRTLDQTVCIGTSATIADKDNPDAAKSFASRFFGVKEATVEVVGEAYERDVWADPARRWAPIAISNPSQALEDITAAVAIGEEALRKVFFTHTQRKLEPGLLEDSLYKELSACSLIMDLAGILIHPSLLSQAAEALSLIQKRTVTSEELLFWVTLGAEARQQGRSLLRPVVHGFLRGIGGAGVAWPEGVEQAQLHLSAEESVSVASKDLARLPLSTCTTCGQHYYHAWLRDFKFIENDKMPVGGKATEESSYWEPLDEASGGNRVVLVDRLVGADDDGLGHNKLGELHFCRYCGTAHPKAMDRCLHCGRQVRMVVLQAVKSKEETPGWLTSCLTCVSPGRRMGSRYREPCRPVRAVQVADVHVLAQDMLHAAERKRLLVFCDNRQDAAFQSGWMQDHARRYRLRALINSELKQGGVGVSDLVIRLDRHFEADISLSRALLPEVWRQAPKEDASSQEHDRLRHKYLRIQVLREISMGWRQRTGLEPWGRMKIQYHGLESQNIFVVNHANRLQIPPEDLCDGIASALDQLRRSQILFDLEEPIYGRIWNDGDEEVQQGFIPSGIRPGATKLETSTPDEKKWLTGWLSQGHLTALRAIVQKWGVKTENSAEFLKELFDFLVAQGFLVPVQLKGNRGRILPGGGDCHQVNSAKLMMHPNKGRFVCDKCRRPAMRKTPRMACLAWRCDGTLEWKSEDEDNYDLNILDEGITAVRPEEHTAMVPNSKRERIENLFKGESDSVNCLVCTQTLEMGVDIGSLDATLLRNVPPLPANYWQRVGRAGRRHRMALNFTYCRGVSHDRSYFQEPMRILDGRIDPPAFHLGNSVMVSKHVHAAVLTLLQQMARDPAVAFLERSRITEEIGKAFPARVTTYLFENGSLRQTDYDLSGFRDLINRNAARLIIDMRAIFNEGWPDADANVVDEASLKQAIETMPEMLEEILRRLRRRVRWAMQQITRVHSTVQQRGAPLREDEAVRRRCESYLRKLRGEKNRSRSESQGYDDVVTFGVLAAEGFLPGYGLDSGNIVGSAEVPWWAMDSRELVLPRPSAVALREYVPGNLIYSNGQKFVPRRFEIGGEEDRSEVPVFEVDIANQALRSLPGQGTATALAAGELVALAMSDVQLVHTSQISDDEDNRFQMSVGVFGIEKGQHEGGSAWDWGTKPIHLRKATRFRMVNVGAKSELEKTGNLGYPVCTVCGASVSPFSSKRQLEDFENKHLEWCQRTPLRVGFYADVIADAMFFPSCTDRSEAYSLLEGLRMAACEVLEMHSDDLQVLVLGKIGSETVDGVLWDPMPGGSGLLQQMTLHWDELIAKAKELAANCPSVCERSCPDCLQTYRNAFYHQHLDRVMLNDWLTALGSELKHSHDIPPVMPSERPVPGAAPVNTSERKLRRLLLKAGFPEFTWQKSITLNSGMGFTIPDAVFEDADENLNIAIYEDGMSVGLHGNPATAERDRFLRAALRSQNWEVLEITNHDLDDPLAMAKHFKKLARWMGLLESVRKTVETPDWHISPNEESPPDRTASKKNVLPFRIMPNERRKKWQNCLPLIRSLKVAAGRWSEEQTGLVSDLERIEDWIELPEGFRSKPGMFVAQIHGTSMNRIAESGAWCIFMTGPDGSGPLGSRQGKRVLVQHSGIRDPESGSLTFKTYSSEKIVSGDSFEHTRITLEPHSTDPGHLPIILTPEDEGEVRVLAEFVEVLVG